jgi:TetR/AcrR family transcriptional regulator, mexJK operon transcriptional repressor
MRIEPEVRRDAILNIASEIFLERGYAGTSMAVIANAVGGSKGTLYKYFSSKKDIFAALVVKLISDQFKPIIASVVEDTSINCRLLQLARRHLTLALSPRTSAIRRLVLSEANRHPELGALFFEIGLNWGHSEIIEVLKLSMKKQELCEADAATAALHFRALCEAGIAERYYWTSGEVMSEDDIHRAASIGVRTFLAAYGKE